VTLSKRDLLLAMATGVAATGIGQTTTVAADAASPAPDHDMSGMPPSWHRSEKIAFLIYPKFTALDMVGPHHMLASLMGATTCIVAKTKVPVSSDMGMTFVPSHSFADCPNDLDIICVPGGAEGTLAAMEDEATIAFLKDRGSRAKYITSVCTGSLVLGAAGLLKGYKATSHWVARELLSEFGAEPIDKRIVVDRNRITGAGVTAGLDFGLSLVRTLRDDDYAKSVQLLAEYQPLDAGTPERAGPATTKPMADMFTGFSDKVRALARGK
jgi:cyclohexyl-isocyanide hydratase